MLTVTNEDMTVLGIRTPANYSLCYRHRIINRSLPTALQMWSRSTLRISYQSLLLLLLLQTSTETERCHKKRANFFRLSSRGRRPAPFNLSPVGNVVVIVVVGGRAGDEPIEALRSSHRFRQRRCLTGAASRRRRNAILSASSRPNGACQVHASQIEKLKPRCWLRPVARADVSVPSLDLKITTSCYQSSVVACMTKILVCQVRCH